jgi:hypothetical protein
MLPLQENKRSGKGVYTFTSGAKYEGEWKQDLKHGKGIYTFPNGDV